jgi:hypothetical protein
MTANMSSDNVLCQSSLGHTNSTKTLIFVETWHNTGINVIQTKLFFWCVYHSRLTICDCLRFTKVCFCPYTSEKQFCLNDINSSVMPRLDENQRLRAIGMLQAELAQNVVARHFGCHRNTILSLWRRFRQSVNTRNHRRSGRPRVTSRRQDNHIRLVHLRNRFQKSNLTVRNIPGLRPISSRTVRTRLRGYVHEVYCGLF